MPSVGDTVYLSMNRIGDIKIAEGKVIKVTPTGQFTVDCGEKYTRRFMPDGSQIGGDRWYSARLIDGDNYERLKARQKEIEAGLAVRVHIQNHLRFATKADMIAFADKLRTLIDAVPDDYRSHR